MEIQRLLILRPREDVTSMGVKVDESITREAV
jgi:hypothetical protein